MNGWEGILVAALSGLAASLIGLVPMWWKLRTDRAQLEVSKPGAVAEASETTVRTAINLIKELSETVSSLKAELEVERSARRIAEDRVDELENRVKELEDQLAEVTNGNCSPKE